MLQNWSILLRDDRLEHRVILDGLRPEVWHALLVSEIAHICRRMSLGLLCLGLFLLLRFDYASDGSLKLALASVKLDAGIIESSGGSVENLVPFLEDRELTPLEGL